MALVARGNSKVVVNWRHGLRVQRTRLRGERQRRGVAAVEAAITLPLLVLLVFGAMELANGIFLNQSLSIAAYEGARAVSRSGASNAQAESRIAEILAARDVENYEVTISPTVTSNTPRGTELQVTVAVTTPGQGLGPLRLLSGRSFSKRVVMVRL